MERIRINAAKGYEVLLGKDILSELGNECAKLFEKGRALIITDDLVGNLYGNAAKESLSSCGFSVFYCELPHGEKSKTLEKAEELLFSLSSHGFCRNDFIVALGGGVIGDIAGFVASVYMRGIPYVSVSTTLLSDVDSSIGGKTGIDTKFGKNLVGTFYNPLLVITDLALLSTLPQKEVRCGVGEIAKYAVLDKELFSMLSENASREDIISRCIKIKKACVEEDEFDCGRRALLNLGHTLAHAIEKKSDYKISHGEAVAMGLYMMLQTSLKNGLIDKKEFDKIAVLFENIGIYPVFPYELSELLPEIWNDKKRVFDGIELIVPKGVGNVEKIRMTKSEAEEFFLE